jgi:hypothetical protein
MAIGDIFKTYFVGSLHGQLYNNVFHFKAKTNAATSLLAATELHALFDNVQRNKLSRDLSLIKCIATNITNPVADIGEKLFSVGRIGNVLADSAPSWVAVVISFRTALVGKRFRGRLFVGAVSVTHILGNNLSGTGGVNFGSYATELMNKYGPAGTSANFQLGVFSRKIGGQTVPANPAGFTPYTQAIVRQALGSEQKRKPGVGN